MFHSGKKRRLFMDVELYRGYQRIGLNLTNGKQDMHEAIDVSVLFA